ncbi:MAG: PHP domain-containing protein [Elusimicrobia bacterium HGW-Elusimicrobia-1]|jgi:histidinol phosphatase-like PHP family hydrolase|nr:MAG: PHP domain-containing protein [Elusimicrobia bacterium HGW-Elusimicrobia-1]
MYIDLHTHSFFSDGALLPSELVSRAVSAGYDAVALTDHVDFTNMDFVIPRILRVEADLSKYYGIKVIAGCEITYVPPAQIGKAVGNARRLGARIVVVHGETPAEPVPAGTNRAAIMAGCDILAHPGFISVADVKLAASRGVTLEITTRMGHKRGNRHVAKLALAGRCAMVLNTDTHTPENLLDAAKIRRTLASSGLKPAYYEVMKKNSAALARAAFRKSGK